MLTEGVGVPAAEPEQIQRRAEETVAVKEVVGQDKDDEVEEVLKKAADETEVLVFSVRIRFHFLCI
jgi:hypothetical protein